MEELLVVNDPFPGIGIIRIFRPTQNIEGNIEYRVDIDSLPTIFQMNKAGLWGAVRHANFISEEINRLVSNLIKGSK